MSFKIGDTVLLNSGLGIKHTVIEVIFKDGYEILRLAKVHGHWFARDFKLMKSALTNKEAIYAKIKHLERKQYAY